MQLSATNSFLTATIGRSLHDPLSKANSANKRLAPSITDDDNSNTKNKANISNTIFKAASQQNNVVFRLNESDPQDRTIIKPSIAQYLTTENLAKREAIGSLVGLDVYV